LLSSCGDGEEKTITTTIEKTKTVTTTVGEGVPVTVTETKQVGDGETVTRTTTSIQTVGGVEPAFEEEKSYVNVVGPSCTEIAAFDVKNGKIIRTRPLHLNDYYDESFLSTCDWEITTAKHRKTGETVVLKNDRKTIPSYLAVPYKKRVYSPKRILYPLKRVDWEPGGDPTKFHPETRGISKFKRVSWDYVVEVLADEVKRIHDTYGLYSVLCKSDSCHREAKMVNGNFFSIMLQQFFSLMGGYTESIRNPDSWEGYYYGISFVWGMNMNGFPGKQGYQTYDVGENTDMLLCWGCDWDTTAAINGCFPSKVMRWYKDLGIKLLHIAPDLNWMNVSNPDKWIPVIPGTDVALQCAIIHTWLKEDTWDKEYIATHVANDSAGHNGMEYIEDYIMGRSDDMIEKTPQWAAPRCGVKPWTIKAIARQWATKRTSTVHACGGSAIRGPYTHEYARYEAVCLGMQGYGRLGCNMIGNYPPVTSPTSGSYTTTAFSDYAAGVANRIARAGGHAASGYPIATKQHLVKTRVAEAILEGHVELYGTGRFMVPPSDMLMKYVYPIDESEGGSRIHMIWQDHACMGGCWCDSNYWYHALRDPSVELFVIQQPWFETDCIFADIVLPVTTNYEEEDIISNTSATQHGILCYRPVAIPPVGESKPDWQILIEVGKKLEQKYGGIYEGLEAKMTGGMTTSQLCRQGFDNSGAQDLVSWEEFSEKGFVCTPLKDGWDDVPHCMIEFYENPDKNPLATPSGKLEFYSQLLADGSPDDTERKPYPRYLCGGPDWPLDESLDTEMGAEQCKNFEYPLLYNSQHVRWRVHGQLDDVPWLREIPTCKIKGYDGYMYEPVWIHPSVAEEKGLKNGDIVKVHNSRGVELGAIYITERIVPQSVHQDHGSHLDYISCAEEDWNERDTKWINRSGTGNTICPDYRK
jgi:trimethylamine-N-oxide reductase (cytochrome c)